MISFRIDWLDLLAVQGTQESSPIPQLKSINSSALSLLHISGFISFRINWFDLLAVQGTQESSPTPQFESINSSVLSLLYGPILTSIHDFFQEPG